jgi:predicted nucleotidyltransferase component of viral defense system
MATPSFELRELFHLAFLRHLSLRLKGRTYAVKGGICLRFFHRSPRLSEDMDLDVVSNVAVKTLANAVDSVVSGAALAASLRSHGILRITATKPKQTETTQRWKISLHLDNNGSLPTKIEFSRRNETLAPSQGVPQSDLLNHYRMSPFVAQFYDALSMAVQKLSALASPSRYAVRDLFDLHHLFQTIGVKPMDLKGKVSTEIVQSAVDKMARFKNSDFNEQVLPYLPQDLIALYRGRAAFETLKSETESSMIELLP